MLLASLIYIASCSKSTPAATTVAPSLTGTWGVVTQGEKLTVNGVLRYDTTINSPLGSGAFTFAANGYYVEYYPGGFLGGAYTYSGNALALFDSAGGANKWINLTVDTLTANTLTFQETVDSIKNGGLDSVFYVIFNLTR